MKEGEKRKIPRKMRCMGKSALLVVTFVMYVPAALQPTYRSSPTATSTLYTPTTALGMRAMVSELSVAYWREQCCVLVSFEVWGFSQF